MDIHNPDGSDYEESDALNQHVREPSDPDGVIAAEKQRMWREGKLASPPVQLDRLGRPRRWPLVLSALGVLLVLLTGAYYLGVYRTSVPLAKKAQATKQKEERKFAQPVTATKRYDSTAFGLSMDYPQNWIVAETKDKITVTSPNYAMQTTGNADAGHVVVTIQNQQSRVPGYPSAGAYASLESQKLTYKNPSGVQRSETYLSLLGYDGTGDIDAMYLTGDNAYQKGQGVPMADVARGNPHISVTFVSCTKSYCTSGQVEPLTLRASSWQKAVYKAQVTNLLESLVFN